MRVSIVDFFYYKMRKDNEKHIATRISIMYWSFVRNYFPNKLKWKKSLFSSEVEWSSWLGICISLKNVKKWQNHSCRWIWNTLKNHHEIHSHILILSNSNVYYSFEKCLGLSCNRNLRNCNWADFNGICRQCRLRLSDDIWIAVRTNFMSLIIQHSDSCLYK